MSHLRLPHGQRVLTHGVLLCRRSRYDFRRADAVLKALNVTSGRHVGASTGPTVAVDTVATIGSGSLDAAQHVASQPAPATPQPLGEPIINGHTAVLSLEPCLNQPPEESAANRHATDLGTEPCQNGISCAGNLTSAEREDEDDRAATGAAAKRLKLNSGSAGESRKAYLCSRLGARASYGCRVWIFEHCLLAPSHVSQGLGC